MAGNTGPLRLTLRVNIGGIKDEVPVRTSGSMFSRRAESLSMAARSLG